ncbi:MAG TPA: MFS transporter [Melioribacteraceae bacterium]|nr:MFS transporter [Melioribacteraceae bacterium]
MKNKASLSIIFVTVFIDLMGFGILIPILPTFASKDLNISDFGIGVIVAIYSLIQFLFNPVFGKISDRIGRRPVILVTQLVTVASYLIFSFADSFLILFLSRLLAGFGGSNIGVAQAYIADITSKEERVKGMGLIGAAFGLGFVFGPLIGAILSKYGYHVAGYGSAGFSFMAFVFALFMLPESNKDLKSGSKFEIRLFDFKYTKKVISDSRIGFLIILFFMIVFSMANIYGTFAILGYKVYHFSDQQTGMLFGISGIIGALIQGGLLRFLSNKISDRSLVLSGSFAMIIGLGFLPFGSNFTGVAIIISILSIGTGILQPTILSMISKYTAENEQGALLGINQSFSAFARVLGPLWGGFAYDFFGYQFPFLTGAAFTFVAFLLSYFLLKPERMVETGNV